MSHSKRSVRRADERLKGVGKGLRECFSARGIRQTQNLKARPGHESRGRPRALAGVCGGGAEGEKEPCRAGLGPWRMPNAQSPSPLPGGGLRPLLLSDLPSTGPTTPSPLTPSLAPLPPSSSASGFLPSPLPFGGPSFLPPPLSAACPGDALGAPGGATGRAGRRRGSRGPVGRAPATYPSLSTRAGNRPAPLRRARNPSHSPGQAEVLT